MIQINPSIVETSDYGIIIIDDRSIIQAANSTASDLFGYSSEEIIGKNVNMLVPQSIRKNHIRIINQYFEKDNTQSRTLCLSREVNGLRKDGTTFSIELTINQIALDKKFWLIGVMNEVAKVPQKITHLPVSSQSNERLIKCLFNNAKSGILVMVDEGPVFANNYLLEKLGYTLENLTKLKIKDLIHADEFTRFSHTLIHWRGQNTTGLFKFHFITSVGEQIRLEVIAIKTDWKNHSAEMFFLHELPEETYVVSDATKTSDKDLSSILDNMQDTYYRTDLEGRLILMSRSAKQLLGYSPNELLGKQLANLYMDPQGREKFLEELRSSHGAVKNYEAQLRRKDGSALWVSTSAQYYYDKEGVIAGVEGITRDVSELKAAEDLRSRFGRILDNSANEVYIFDAYNLHFRQVNRGALKNLGYSAKEMERLTPLDIKPDFTWGQFYELLQPLHDGLQDQVVFETRHRRKDGTSYPVEVHLQLSHEESPPVFLAVILDITERKRNEQEMRKLSSVLEQTADSVMVTDCNGNIEYVNKAFETTTGFSRNEAIGRKSNLVKSGRHEKIFYQRMWQTVLAGEVFQDVLINRKKDGTLYYEEKTITPIKDAKGFVTSFVSTGKDITERMQVQERLHYLAHHDVLTELPNRILCMDRLKHAISRTQRSGRLLAVLFLDLDRFKNINDSLGHDVGDRMLKAMAKRLINCVREEDTVARVGGDEFAIIFEDILAVEDGATVARKILHALSKPFVLEGQELFITSSIGISIYPNDSEDARVLLKNADVAMHRSKDLGRNSYQFYSSDMGARALERLTLETNLRYALERKEFTLHYQPLIDLKSEKILGMEALLRWQHPELGLISPSDFIPILEDIGLIVQIGEWVLHTACTQAKEWERMGYDFLRVAVNLSGTQFNDPHLIPMIENVLHKTGLDANLLELEITESVIMRSASVVVDNLDILNSMGVRLAIDDFGTGYSSLSYLKRFPINTLKIDRSFVSDITSDSDDAAIVQTIVAMAHSLKLEVVAEGVENEEQLEFLRACSCDVIQGFHFSVPLSVDEVPGFLKSK